MTETERILGICFKCNEIYSTDDFKRCPMCYIKSKKKKVEEEGLYDPVKMKKLFTDLKESKEKKETAKSEMVEYIKKTHPVLWEVKDTQDRRRGLFLCKKRRRKL